MFLALCKRLAWDASGSELGSSTPARSPAASAGFLVSLSQGEAFSKDVEGVSVGTALYINAGWLPGSAGVVGMQLPSSWSGSQPCSFGSSGDNSDSLKRGDKSSSLALV